VFTICYSNKALTTLTVIDSVGQYGSQNPTVGVEGGVWKDKSLSHDFPIFTENLFIT